MIIKKRGRPCKSNKPTKKGSSLKTKPIDKLKKERRNNKNLKEQLHCVEEGKYNLDNEEFVYQK